MQFRSEELIRSCLHEERSRELYEKSGWLIIGGERSAKLADAQGQSGLAARVAQGVEIQRHTNHPRSAVFPRDFRLQRHEGREIRRALRDGFDNLRGPAALPDVNVVRQGINRPHFSGR